MKFGKLSKEEIDQLEFNLPADHPDTAVFLSKQEPAPLKVYMGAPSWANKSWVGKIYPKRTKSHSMLSAYARHYNSIELNTTFYRTPQTHNIERWISMTAADFKFCPKVSQVISHRKHLNDCAYEMGQFTKVMNKFTDQLGPSFMTLPPQFSPSKLAILTNFLKLVPKDFLFAIEFRHPGWFSDPVLSKEVFDLLEERQIINIITDTAGRQDVLHQRLTHTTAIIRFVGNELHPSDYSRMDQWVDKIIEWNQKGLKEVYLFFHQPEEELVPELTNYFIEQMNKKGNFNIPLLEFLPKEGIQGTLF